MNSETDFKQAPPHSAWRKNTQHKYGRHMCINAIFSPFNSLSDSFFTFSLK